MNIRYPIYEGVYRILTVEYKGKIYPSTLFKKGRPIPGFKSYLQIQKLFIS